MFDKLKGWFGKDVKVNQKPTEAPPMPPVRKARESEKTTKQIATEKGEAYITMLSMEIDPENLGQGAFELDWNEIFVADLVRHGYMMNPNDTDADIVDRWFTDVCRNVVLETWEQEQAINPTRVVKSRNIGDGRSEVS